MNNAFAVDVGYGFLKWANEKNKYSVMPSLVARGRDNEWNPGLESLNGFRVQWNGYDFLVGETASVMSKTSRANQSRSRIDSAEALAYLYATLAAQFPNGAKRILMVTGLPIDYMPDREVYKNTWEGTHSVYINGSSKATVWEILRVFIAPQGFGALCDLVFDVTKDGVQYANKDLLNQKTIVADTGTLTFNVFAFQSRAYQEDQSGSTDLGMRWAIERVRSLINQKHKVALHPHQVDEAIRTGVVKTQNGPVDIQGLIAPTLNALAEEQAEFTRSTVGEEFSQVDSIIVTGGGAHRLGAFYKNHINHHGVVMTTDSQGANVRGFWNWANYLEQKSK